LAAFLAAFGSGEGEVDEATGSVFRGGGGGRRSGRSGGVDRCPLHAPRGTVASKGSAATTGSSTAAIVACSGSALAAVTHRERERYVALLRSSTSEAEWRQLGSVDIDSTMCDLFSWLGDRGLCSACVDAVTGALLEVRRAVTGNCTCSRCLGLCSGSRGQKAPKALDAAEATTPSVVGGPPELLRVQGQLRAICGVYRLEALPFNGKPVYKKERAEAYLLYTMLKDWMVSGKPDAGGSRCEGWAYVTDPAETPDEVCGVWKVSGPRGWEEDPTLCVSVFEGLPEDMRAGLGYDDGSAIARRLSADDRGVLAVPLQEADVLEEVLWVPDAPPPISVNTGECTHVTTAEMAQQELRCWLRWLLRERLEAQRWKVLAQAQVAASLCRLFACAALQQLEQAAEDTPCTPQRKGRKKKGRIAVAGAEHHKLEDIAGPEVIDCDDEVAGGDATQKSSGAAWPSPLASSASTSASTPMSSKSKGCHVADSDESASTRASSEEPPDARRAELALGARRLMEQMGWRPTAMGKPEMLGSTEVAAWREQHPGYRQAVDEGRQRLKVEFQNWAQAADGPLAGQRIVREPRELVK